MICKTLFFLCFAIVQISSQGDLLSEWKSFKSTYRKMYSSPMEEMSRMSTFASVLKDVTEFNSQSHSYKQGINAFSDLTPKEMNSMINTGIGPPTNITKFFNLNFEAPVYTKQAASSIDWRSKGAVTGVKNQGSCGSCWAFSAVATLEGMEVIKKKSKLTALSEQHLVDCYKKDCNGQYVWEALKYVKNNGGISNEASYPYKSGDGKAKTCADNKSTYMGKISGHQMVYNENDLTNAVSNIGIVSVQICVPKTWVRYKSGIYDDEASCKSKECDTAQHAVAVVGYGTEGSIPYWIVKNSWGTGWGEKGYIRMVKGKNMCSIGSWAVYPLP